jgi:SAM-dependent methyltransferase
MDWVSCNLCGADNPQLLFVGPDRLVGAPGEFRLSKCGRCGLVYLTPRPSPDEIGAYYPEDYHPFLYAIEDERSWLRRLDRRYGLHKRCRAVIRRAGQPGRVLDVGCATGIFLQGMRQRGWEPQGVELSPSAASYARSRFGLPVVEGELETAAFEPASFDLVTLWDVLEHVPEPDRTLGECARVLKPGGWLVMSLPNPEAWEARWFGRYWAGWDVPRHFHVFRQAHLRQYLEAAGFELCEVSSFTGRHGVLVLSLDFWTGDWRVPPAVARAVRALARSIPARLLTYPYYAVADRLNKSSIMTVFARRRPG